MPDRIFSIRPWRKRDLPRLRSSWRERRWAGQQIRKIGLSLLEFELEVAPLKRCQRRVNLDGGLPGKYGTLEIGFGLFLVADHPSGRSALGAAEVIDVIKGAVVVTLAD